jgi:hypothetical protein
MVEINDWNDRCINKYDYDKERTISPPVLQKKYPE